MSVGFPVAKQDIDQNAGDIARRFQASFDDVATMSGFLNRTADTDLVALGYTEAEVATLKTAFADLAQLGRIWGGLDPLPAAHDFRVFVSRLWGVGAF